MEALGPHSALDQGHSAGHVRTQEESCLGVARGHISRLCGHGWAAG